MSEEKIQKLLGKVHVTRRDAVRKLIVGAAFSVPVVMSFTMGGIPVHKALALTANGTGS
jgi:hypothetical protein